MSQSFDYHKQPFINETKLKAVLSTHWEKAASIDELKLYTIIFRIQEQYHPGDKSVPWRNIRDRVLKTFFPCPDDVYTRKTYASILGSYFSRRRSRVPPKTKKKRETLSSKSKTRTLSHKVHIRVEPNGQFVWDL